MDPLLLIWRGNLWGNKPNGVGILWNLKQIKAGCFRDGQIQGMQGLTKTMRPWLYPVVSWVSELVSFFSCMPWIENGQLVGLFSFKFIWCDFSCIWWLFVVKDPWLLWSLCRNYLTTELNVFINNIFISHHCWVQRILLWTILARSGSTTQGERGL
jgi:hypothetical protein